MTVSVANRLGRLVPEAQERILAELGPLDARRLLYAWRFWARPEQVEPEGKWTIWVVDAGRGFGKTRCGAEWVRKRIEYDGAREIALIAATYKDLRDTMLGEGKTDPGEGFLNIWPPEMRPEWKEQKRRVVLKDSSGRERDDVHITVQSAEDSEFRGPNCDTIWCDELCKWPKPEALWDNIEMTLRRPGAPPRVCVTTTPNEMGLLDDLENDPDTVVTRGSMFDNIANLSPEWVSRMVKKYAGTQLGLQELFAIVQKGDRMFPKDVIEQNRRHPPGKFRRAAVGVDPGVSQNRGSDQTGIVGAGELDGEIYVTDDSTARHSADQWGFEVLEVFWRLEQMTAPGGIVSIVVERNKGGDLVRANLTMLITVIEVDPRHAALRQKYGAALRRAKNAIVEVHAFDGKKTRAEPVAAAHDQGKIHLAGKFPILEKQLVTFNPMTSSMANKDAFDAFVHCAWHLLRLEKGFVDYDGGMKGLASQFDVTRKRREDLSQIADELDEDDDDWQGPKVG